MSNVAKHIKLVQFRNFKSIEASFVERLNIITGLNGVGKSSLIDAVYCTAFGRSYFASSDKYLVKNGEDFYRIETQFGEKDNLTQVNISYPLGKKKSLELNAKKYKKLSDHVGKIPIVCIAPGDVKLIQDGSELRRRFLNLTLSQIDRTYLDHLSNYNRLLKQRNAWLKQDDARKKDTHYLSIIDQQMNPHAQYIYDQRSKVCKALSPLFSKLYQSITNHKEDCTIVYESHLSQGSYMEMSQAVQSRDKLIGRSSRGPHKDDINFYINDLPLRQIGSQGQIKSFLFALKLAQFEHLSQHTQKTPILLLDDIFDKLDNERVALIMSMVYHKWSGQIFITDTSIERLIDILKELKIGFRHLYISDAQISTTDISH